MRELRDRWLVAAEAGDVLGNPSHPQWMAAARFVHEATEGKAQQSVDVTSGGKPLTNSERDARLEAILTMLAQRRAS